MTRETILRNSLEMATHNLQCYSKNWEMTEPKDGCETEYKEAAEACEVSKAAVHSWCAGIKPIPQARRELLAERLGILI